MIDKLNTTVVIYAIAGFLAADKLGFLGRSDEALAEKVGSMQAQLSVMQASILELKTQTGERYRSSNAAADFAVRDARIVTTENKLGDIKAMQDLTLEKVREIDFKQRNLERRLTEVEVAE